jgi:hypothetical protein
LRRCGDRPNLGVGIGRIAHARRLREGNKLVDELVVDAFLHKKPRAGNAGLPDRREDA